MENDIKLDKNHFCLSCNIDRYKYLCKVFQKVGLNPPAFFPGLIHPVGHIGCTLGHISMIMMARAMNLPYVVIYEDDAYPCIDIIEKFNDILIDLDDHHISWGMLSLGRNGDVSGYDDPIETFWGKYQTDQQRNSLPNKIKYITDKIIQIPKNPNGSHSYIIKKQCYNEWLTILSTNNFVDICMGSDNFKLNSIYWTKDLLFVQKQIDSKCMTQMGMNTNKQVFIYPYNYNKDRTGVCSVFQEPPVGFKSELL